MDFGGVGTDDLAVVAVLVGVVAFFYSNLGLGGGQLYVPIMVLVFGSALSIVEIIPLSLCFAFVTMLSSTIIHHRRGLVDFRLGTKLALAGLLGVLIGVAFTTNASEDLVKGAFAAMLVIVATKMMFDIYADKKENPATAPTPGRRLLLAGMGVSILTGVLIGMFGIGGGVVSVPLIIYVFRFETRKAIGTSALMGAILTPAALLAYAWSQSTAGGFTINYDIALVLTPIVLVCALVGSMWGLAKLRTRVVKTIFTCGVYLAAALMIYSILTS